MKSREGNVFTGACQSVYRGRYTLPSYLPHTCPLDPLLPTCTFPTHPHPRRKFVQSGRYASYRNTLLLGDANGDLSCDVLSANTLNDNCKDADITECDNHDTASVQSNACLRQFLQLT